MLEFAHISLAAKIVLQKQMPNGAVVEGVQVDHLKNLLFVYNFIVDNCNSIICCQAQSALLSLRTIAQYSPVVLRRHFFISDSFSLYFL